MARENAFMPMLRAMFGEDFDPERPWESERYMSMAPQMLRMSYGVNNMDELTERPGYIDPNMPAGPRAKAFVRMLLADFGECVMMGEPALYTRSWGHIVQNWYVVVYVLSL